jgi:hypothetical protein
MDDENLFRCPSRAVNLLDKVFTCLGTVINIEIYDDVTFGGL